MSELDLYALPCVAAGALITNPAGEILLVNPTYKELWEVPGGYLRPGETPSQALAREVGEELGIAVAIGPLLVADWAPHPQEGDKLLFLFDCGIMDSLEDRRIRLDTAEVSEYAYHPRQALPDLLVARLAVRVAAALDARARGATVYLEHGMRPGRGA